MKTIVKYMILDLVRNKTVLVYAIVLAVLSTSILGFDSNASKGLLSLMNITLLFVPIITILFATIYFFNSIEFTELLLAQPVRRPMVLLAEYIGLSSALSLAYFAGIGLPLIIIAPSPASFTLIITGILLTLIFSAFALLIFVMFKDKTKGIGVAIITSLFFTILFDGLLMAFIYAFSDYPIEETVVGILSFSPIDLARVLMLLKLDVAVLMGYSGAVFKKFLGSSAGTIYSFAWLVVWMVLPLILAIRIFKKKDL
jgi:Cu-processing system permease protein